MVEKLALEAQCQQYSNFVASTLKPEYETAEDLVNSTREEIDGYNGLLERMKEIMLHVGDNLIEGTSTTTTEIVNLGHQALYCEAVANVDRIFVNVGMGFHAELTIPEAIAFVEKRLQFLKNDVLAGRREKLKQISDHLEAASSILLELQRELQR